MGKFTLRVHARVGARIAKQGQSGHIRAQSGRIRATTEWPEFDFEKAEWRIPTAKMKMGEQHIVALARQAVAVL